jgi:hypothetical protein
MAVFFLPSINVNKHFSSQPSFMRVRLGANHILLHSGSLRPNHPNIRLALKMPRIHTSLFHRIVNDARNTFNIVTPSLIYFV